MSLSEPEPERVTEKDESKRPILHQNLTYQIIGAAMRVHNELGPGHKEIVYQRALSSALKDANLSFEEEKPVDLMFNGDWVGILYLDHLVEDAVVVEEKALSHLITEEEVAQVITYLAATQARVGLLFNFGRSRLQYRRILPPAKFDNWQARAQRYAWRPAGVPPSNPIIRSPSVVEEAL